MEKSVLILGGNSDLGFALGKTFLNNGFKVLFATRDVTELSNRISQLTDQSRASIVSFDALQFSSHEAWFNSLPFKPEITVCAFGMLGDQRQAEQDWMSAKNILETNYIGAVSILNVVAEYYEQQKHGMIVGISSVAGDRGRQSNYLYGSAKAGFSEYLSGLRNRLFKAGVHVLTVKPGFLRTKMTAGLNLPPMLTDEPERAARRIYNAVLRKRNVVYVKPVWFLIMLIIKSIPEIIFKRLKL
ncbi:MAG: SDR family oxidoreductase [Cyclobacteriaceae bacterium]|nr:SDR family oxidoreductase [Cyclobacteriaceae bacterium]